MDRELPRCRLLGPIGSTVSDAPNFTKKLRCPEVPPENETRRGASEFPCPPSGHVKGFTAMHSKSGTVNGRTRT